MKRVGFFFVLSFVFSISLFAGGDSKEFGDLSKPDKALLHAVHEKSLEGIRAAVEGGANVDLTIVIYTNVFDEMRTEGRSVLEFAKEKGNQEIIDYLEQQIRIKEQKEKIEREEKED